MINITDWEFEEQQSDAFYEYLKKNKDGRQTKGNAVGYQEEEMESFFAGWLAAKKHFGAK